jgi:hypothetical protein
VRRLLQGGCLAGGRLGHRCDCVVHSTASRVLVCSRSCITERGTVCWNRCRTSASTSTGRSARHARWSVPSSPAERSLRASRQPRHRRPPPPVRRGGCSRPVADIPDVVLAAGVDAAAHMDARPPRDLDPLALQVRRQVEGVRLRIDEREVAVVVPGACHQASPDGRRVRPQLRQQWFRQQRRKRGIRPRAAPPRSGRS